MTFQISVSPSGNKFSCAEDETILTAALRAGVGLPYGCKNGACGSCKGKVTEGSVTHGSHQQKTLPESEAAEGFSLFCCAYPHSDVQIEIREIASSSDYPVKKLPSRVASLQKVSDDVMIVTLQLPATERFAYRAGQYIDFLLRDGKRRSYSIANASHTSEQVSLHIRHMRGGLFTDQVFSTLKERDILRFEGPQGTFFLREDSDKPIILLASGTGFAPVKALVEQLVHIESKRPVSLYWGGRRPADLYMDALCKEWAATLPNFTYVPVISDALAEDAWNGRDGFVHAAVLDDHPDLSGYQVYACGAPIVVNSAKRDFVALAKLPADEFYADAFTSEADLAA
jgi:CDP-4-dehydro-6-deoxyglucose reductase, E3